MLQCSEPARILHLRGGLDLLDFQRDRQAAAVACRYSLVATSVRCRSRCPAQAGKHDCRAYELFQRSGRGP